MLLPGILLLTGFGCTPHTGTPSAGTEGKASAQPPLRVLVVDDPELAKALEREWASVGGDPLAIRQATEAEVLDKDQRRLASDVVIIPSPLLGELAGRNWLQPLDEKELNDARWQRHDIFELIRLQETKWGRATVAVPLGSPTFVLLYRADLFEKLAMKPPATWGEYVAAAERLSDRSVLGDAATSPGEEWHGACEPAGKGWAGEWLLARAAPYARHRSQFSTLFDFSDLRPLIDGPPFVRALEEMVAAARYCPRDTDALDPAAVRREFFAGRAAMAVTWLPTPNPADKTSEPVDLKAGFAPLPGSPDAYNFRIQNWEPRLPDESPRVPLIGFAGRLAAVTKECRNPSAALLLLSFMNAPDTSIRVLASSRHTTLFRSSQLAQVGQWVHSPAGPGDGTPYAETLQAIYGEATCLGTLRIPGRQRYLQALDQAVRDALTGKTSPQAALTDVARQWNEITDSLGRDAQRAAYARSIGLE